MVYLFRRSNVRWLRLAEERDFVGLDLTELGCAWRLNTSVLGHQWWYVGSGVLLLGVIVIF